MDVSSAVIVAAVVGTVGFGIARWATRSKVERPPMLPYSVPLLGHTLRFLSDRDKLFQEGTDLFKMKPYMIKIFGKNAYVITDPAQVRSAFSTGGKALDTSDSLRLVHGVYGSYEGRDPNIKFVIEGGPELSAIDGKPMPDTVQYHLQHFAGDSLASLLADSTEQITQSLDKIRGGLPEDGTPMSVDFLDWIEMSFGRIMGDLLFGPNLLREYSDVVNDYRRMVESPYMLLPEVAKKWLAPEAVRNRELGVAAITHFLTDPAMSEGASEIVMDRVRQQRELGASWESAARVAFGLFDGAQANTAPTIFWCLTYITHTPGLREQLMDEMKPAFSDSGELDWKVLVDPKISPLLHSTIFEVMRLITWVFSMRVAQKELTVVGCFVPKGASVFMPGIPVHMSEEIYGADVRTFRADRFVGEGAKLLNTTSLRPFGGGSHECPARRFATSQMKTFIALFFSKFDLAMPGPMPAPTGKPPVTTVSFGPSFRPKGLISRKTI